jgi:DNA-binding transcriptional ArsR family regulator
MDRGLLEGYLEKGLSLEQIAVLVDRDPSTVGYWVKRHGLKPNGREKHASRGGLAKETLEELINAGASQREIAETLGVSQSTVRHWLTRYRLRTKRRHRIREGDELPRVVRDCPVHGRTTFYRRRDGGYKCTECNGAAVSGRRRTLKRILVEEAGGACLLCGYSKCIRALNFHHRDPEEKAFGLSGRGFTRSLAALREEAKKCDLLCSNCHWEVEEGVTPPP